MAFPPYIPLVQCTLGGATSLVSGTPYALKAEITASRGLVWAPTGWQFPAVAHTLTGAPGAELSFALPPTDLSDWRLMDAPGSLVDTSAAGSYSHTYTIRLWVMDGDRPIGHPRTIGPVTIATGADDLSPVDLDLTLPTTTVAGGVVQVPDIWTSQIDALEASLPTTYAGVRADALGVHHGRYMDAKRAKGGVIGTGGKGVVAWRVDHLIDDYRATTWPILRDRGMPAGLGVVTKAIGNTLDIEPTTTTWDQLRSCHWEGNEIWAHSATHKDPAPYGSGLTAYEEIVQPRIDLEAQNLRVMGWQMPGVTGVQDPNYSGNFTTIDQMESDNGQMLLANYGLLEIDRGSQGVRRRIPTDGCFMLGHITIDTMTLALAKTNVDIAADYGGGVEIMHHPKYIGMPGYMSLADFTALVDYVAAKRDAGLIEVLTPSGLAFADPSRSYRMNLLAQSDFEGLSFSGTALGKWTANNVAGISVGTDGGHSGANYVRFADTSGANYLYQPNTFTVDAGVNGAAFMVEAWVRQPDSVGSGTVRFYLMDNSGSTPSFIIDKRITLTPGQAWTKVRVPFCIPKTCPNLMLRISRWPDANTGAVDFDEVRIIAV